MITNDQIALVQRSFQDVLPIADLAGRLLYERIFTLAPEARALFGDDLPAQAARTLGAVAKAVDGLDRLDEIAPFLGRLGARHARYGVVEAHFPVVGEALLWTLEQGLGDGFTPEVREAWTAVWGIVAGAMITGLRQAGAGSDADAA